MDKIINVLLLIIIFVFDPLAISLVIASNFAFSQAYPKKRYKENLYGEKVPIDKEQQRDLIVQMMKADEEDGLYDDLDGTLNDGLDDGFDWEAAEERMNVIGQNGNDGEHYSEIVVDPTLTLTRRDGKTMNLKDYVNQFKTPKPNDDETKTY